MNPVDFIGSNGTYGQPKDWDEEKHGKVTTLHTMSGVDDSGVPYVLSAWQPTVEDLENLGAGLPVYLKICGHGMPPVSLFTLSTAATL